MSAYDRLKPILIIAVVAALFVAMAFTRWNPFEGPVPLKEEPIIPMETYELQRMTLEGTLVCLPHAPGYPPTKECALGLRTDDGTHYAVDFSLMSSIPEEHRVGDRVTGSGVMTPIERLSSDHWQRYEVKGIFSVTDGFRVMR